MSSRKLRVANILNPYLLIFLGPVLLFAPILFTGKVLYWGLPELQFIPWRVAAWGAVIQGNLPLWNPLNGMGAPLIANYQLAFFYPPSWLLYPFLQIGGVGWLAWAYTVLTAAHLILAGCGMVNWMRRLGFSTLAQVVSGISFSLCGYLVARAGFYSMIWAGAWIPWVMSEATKIASPIKKENICQSNLPVGLVLTAVMMLLAGHAQLSWYTVVLASFWVITGGWVNNGVKGALNGFWKLFLAVFLAACLSAVQLIPTAEYLFQSQRSTAVDFETALSYSFWPWRFFTLLAPDFFGNPGRGDYWGYANFWEDAVYIGVLPFLLAAFSLRSIFKGKGNGCSKMGTYKPLLVFLWVVVLGTIVLALGKNTPVFPFLYQYIPTFDMFNAPVRYMIWMEISLVILAGAAVDLFWSTPTGKGLYWLRLATAGGAAVTIGAFFAWRWMDQVNLTFIRSTAISGIWALGLGLLTLTKTQAEIKGQSKLWSGFVVGVIVVDLLTASWNLVPFIDRSFFDNLVSGEERDISLSGDERIYISLTDEVNLKYDRFIRFQDYYPIEDPINIRKVVLPNLNLLDSIATVNNFDPMVPARYTKLMQYIDSINVADQMTWLPILNVGVREKIALDNELGISFDTVPAIGRFRWVSCFKSAQTEDEAFSMLKEKVADLDSKGIESYVVLEGYNTQKEGNCTENRLEKQFNYQIIKESNQKIILETNTNQPGFLLQADVWFPGWKVFVDGKESSLYQADYLFRAVQLPQGRHIVEFVYQPVSFILGIVVSGFSGLLLIILIYRKQKQTIIRKS